MNQPDAISWLALGDSYTIGEGVPPADTWPRQLARALREADVPLADPRVLAATGWTTDELGSAIDAEQDLGRHGFVTLLIGVNNQYRGRSAADYRGEFTDLLRRAIGFAGGRAGRVLVLSIPDWGVTPFALAQGRDRAQVAAELGAYNDAARQVAERHHVAFVDITGTSRAHGAQADMLVADGLHPSAAMHALWCAQALPVAQRLLAAP